jgi:hypothetical protein
MKNLFDRLFANWNANRDAGKAVDGRERFLLERLGPEPVAFDPAGNEEHAQVARDLALEPEIRELEDDIRRAEDLEPSLGTPTGYAIGIAVIAAIELWGSVLVARSIGVPSEYRVLFALGLTLAILYLTHRTAESSALPPNASTAAKVLHGAKRLLTPAVYTLVVFAIAAARSGAEEGGESLNFAESVIMVTTTAGPAWLAAHLETRRAPAAELARRLTALRKRLAPLRARYEAARAFVRNLERARAGWRDQFARLDARYSVHHELASAGQRAPRA